MIEIVIWISPTDIDDLEKSLNRLNIGKNYLTKEQFQTIYDDTVEIIKLLTSIIKTTKQNLKIN